MQNDELQWHSNHSVVDLESDLLHLVSFLLVKFRSLHICITLKACWSSENSGYQDQDSQNSSTAFSYQSNDFTDICRRDEVSRMCRHIEYRYDCNHHALGRIVYCPLYSHSTGCRGRIEIVYGGRKRGRCRPCAYPTPPTSSSRFQVPFNDTNWTKRNNR